MNLRLRAAGLSALFALAASSCLASDHVVFVSDGTFEPKDLTINVGDTVTFKAFGNLYQHNVHGLDESFRCSVGCRGDGSGATGDPAKEWTATVAFDTPKHITYQCDPHATFGMYGSITVVAAAPGLTLRPGLSGNWSDPTANQSGHGFQIEVLPDNGILAIWFVFNPGGNAQNWIYTQAAYDPASSSVTLPAFLEQGGAFPPHFDASKLSVTPWGTLQLSFSDCDNGTATWTSNTASAAAGYGDVTFPIKRVTTIAGMTCP